MVSGSELAADVVVTGRGSIVSGGSVGTASVIHYVLGESCGAECEHDVETFPRAAGAVGLTLSWACSLVLGRNSRDTLGFFARSLLLGSLSCFPRHSFHCIDHMSVNALFLRPANTSLEEDTKFCSHHMFVLSARHDQATTHDATRRGLRASVPSPALRFCFQLPGKRSLYQRHTSLLSTRFRRLTPALFEHWRVWTVCSSKTKHVV